MPLKNYSNIFNEIAKSKLLKLQSVVLFLTTYIDWTLIPFVTKLEGTYLPVFMISFFMLVGALDGFIQPLFKHISIHNIYLFAIILDLVQIASYFIYDYSHLLFTYIILTIFTIQGITFEVARIHTVDFMQDESVELKDYLMIRSFMISGAIVGGAVTAMAYDYFTKDINLLLIYVSILGVMGIVFQYRLYLKFKKRLGVSEVSVDKDKRELYEKFRV
ncbi:MAG: hypothetical protein JXQ66_01025 [Campylobacterales bacterium]|nr:hypothetical protein [Campylobacterales bacterium]